MPQERILDLSAHRIGVIHSNADFQLDLCSGVRMHISGEATYSSSGIGTPSAITLMWDTSASARFPPEDQPATATFPVPYSTEMCL